MVTDFHEEETKGIMGKKSTGNINMPKLFDMILSI